MLVKFAWLLKFEVAMLVWSSKGVWVREFRLVRLGVNWGVMQGFVQLFVFVKLLG